MEPDPSAACHAEWLWIFGVHEMVRTGMGLFWLVREHADAAATHKQCCRRRMRGSLPRYRGRADICWRWKDEDELAGAVEIGRLGSDQAKAIRAEAERVATSIESRAWPFTPEVAMWRPDPQWPIPELLSGWDRP